MSPGFYELEAYAIVCVRWSRGEISKEKKKKKPTHMSLFSGVSCQNKWGS